MMDPVRYYALQDEYRRLQREAALLGAEQEARAGVIDARVEEIAGEIETTDPETQRAWMREQWGYESDLENEFLRESMTETHSPEAREQYLAAAERLAARPVPDTAEYKEWQLDSITEETIRIDLSGACREAQESIEIEF